MFKKMIMVSMMLVLAAVMVFAGGNKETANTNSNVSPDAMKSEILAKIDGLKTQSYTGEVITSNRRFPELKSGDNVYRMIIVPRFKEFDLGLKDKDQITIEAAIMTGELKDNLFETLPMRGMMGVFENSMDGFDTGTYLLVTKMNINGKAYDLKEFINDIHVKIGNNKMLFMGKGRGGFNR